LKTKLRKQDYALLYALALVLALGVSLVQRAPGYTDAEYYFGGGLRLFQGEGFSEMILWNYLDDPSGLPHPSHAYWMPLPSLVAAAGMVLFQTGSFFAGRIFFILLSGLIPPLTAMLAQRLGQDRRGATVAGLLGLFSGFYLIYTTLTEGFTLVMVLGSVFLLTAFGKSNSEETKSYFFLIPGAAAGLMHLTRADGFLWLGAGLLGLMWLYRVKRKAPIVTTLAVIGCMTGGYLLVMGPWFLRNLQTFGGLMPPGGSRTFWLSNYNEIFRYPADQLNVSTWLASGWGAIFKDRLTALWSNLQTALAVQGSIFLLPLMIIGLWHLRRDRRVVLGGVLWLAILGVMSFVFPYSGARGGFFHSGAALQPLLWASVPFGLEVFVAWGSKKRRNWNTSLAVSVFGVGIVLLSLLLTGFLFSQRVIGGNLQEPVWQDGWIRQTVYEAELKKQGATQTDVVMINNPAGLYAATQRSTIVIPDGGPEMASLAAQRYGARFLILEMDHVDGLAALYENPGDLPGLRYLSEMGDARLFEFTEK
jgi:hypothetical protein